jgi:hypothetical protein
MAITMPTEPTPRDREHVTVERRRRSPTSGQDHPTGAGPTAAHRAMNGTAGGRDGCCAIAAACVPCRTAGAPRAGSDGERPDLAEGVGTDG